MAAKAKTLNLKVRLQPKQAQLWQYAENSPATWLGFGGSRGGAKSGGGRRVMLLRRFAHNGTKGLIIRRTFDEVYENHILKYFEEVPILQKWYSATHKAITLPNGSIIKFGYAEHKGDINAFQGQEFMDIFPDEATHFTEDELKFLKTCNRAPGFDDAKCKMWLTMNPGNVGHGFIKRVFFDKMYHENERAQDYAFIQAYAWDNIEWVRTYLDKEGISEAHYYNVWTDKERFNCFITQSVYGRELNALPQAMRIGHLLGRWDIFAGQYFDIFDRARHVFDTSQLGLKDWHRRWISIDWGYAHNAAAYWNSSESISPTKKVTKTYREHFVSQTGPRELAQQVVSKSRLEAGGKEKIAAIYLSPDAFAHRTAESSIAEQMNEVFQANGFPSATKALDDRIGGWMKMYQGLQYDEWLIGSDCKELIKVLPSLTRDDDKREDCIKFDGDDAADAARYGVYSDAPTNQTPYAERVQSAVAEMQKIVPATVQGITDYNIVAMQSRIAEAKLKKEFQPVKRNPRHRWGPQRYAVESYR
jgi:hypothetical protein